MDTSVGNMGFSVLLKDTSTCSRYLALCRPSSYKFGLSNMIFICLEYVLGQPCHQVNMLPFHIFRNHRYQFNITVSVVSQIALPTNDQFLLHKLSKVKNVCLRVLTHHKQPSGKIWSVSEHPSLLYSVCMYFFQGHTQSISFFQLNQHCICS